MKPMVVWHAFVRTCMVQDWLAGSQIRRLTLPSVLSSRWLRRRKDDQVAAGKECFQ